MKKTLLTLPALFIGASLLAQGTVNFGNVGTGTSISNRLTGTAVPSGTTFKAVLYYLPDQATVPTTEDFTTRGTILNPSTTTFALAGQFIGGTRTTPESTPKGGIAYFQVRAWEAAFGSTYDEAKNNPNPIGGRLALIGESTPVRVATGDQALVGPGSLVTAGLRGFYVTPVPEPSVIGLGILGVGAFMLLRRRK
jgi:hypothetical protein